jgi:hypothetical protein
MTVASEVPSQTVLAFDSLAARYDDLFTRSTIGRAQRDAVWDVLIDTFEPGAHILELNCGTGEDALFLADHCVSVVEPFDGAFSNFSGLNCVADLNRTARDLANLVTMGAPVLVCLSTRFCLSEMIWYLLHGQVRKAFRRFSGTATARVGEFTVKVQYPTLRALKRMFSSHFILRSCTGIGVAVPPSYVEPVMRRYPRFLSMLSRIDKRIARLPWFRTIGDHMLVHFERVEGRCW